MPAPKKMKRTRYFSKDQLGQLRSDLTIRAHELLEGSFLPNTYIPSFDDLTSLINKAVSGAAITSAWLCTLFDESTYEVEKKWSVERIDWCCQFLYQKKFSEYFNNSTPKIHPNLEGHYRIFLKEKHPAPGMPLYNYSLNLEITESGCRVDPTDAKNDSFSGNLPKILNGNAYFELDNTKGSEKVYLIIHIGLAEFEGLQYIGGLFLTVNSDAIPMAGSLLLVRNSIRLEEIKYDIFDKILTGKNMHGLYGISIEALKTILKTPEPVKERLSAFYGFYQLYYRDALTDRFLKARLHILDSEHVTLISDRTYYHSGHIQIVSQDRLVINLIGDDRFASLITNFGKFSVDFLEQMKYFIFVYSASGNKTPTTGIVLFKRVSSEQEAILGSFSAETIGHDLPEDLRTILSKSTILELPDVLSYTQY